MNSAIENLNQLGGQFLNFAWPMLWQSSLLIAVVLIVDISLARKIRASVRHALWLVVLAKLLLPPTLTLPTGAAWWLFPVKSIAAPVVGPTTANNYSVVVDDAPLPEDFTPEPVARIEPPKPKLTVAGWMLLACSVVSGGLLGWLLFRWGQLAQKVRGAAKVLEAASPENVQEAFERARLRAGLRAGTRLKLVEGNMSPAVCGLLRPVILLPRILVEKLSAAQLQAVLLHEMIHLRRKDIWVNCAQSLLQIFYWWHPLVWVANARIRRVREEAVDDAVMLALAEDAETYAPTLLEVAKLAFRRPLLSLGLVGIMESRSALRQRIERLMDFHAPRKAGLTLVSVCGIFVFSAVAVPMGQGPARVVRELASNVQATDNSGSIDSVLVGDTFTNLSGVRIARLNADGSLDVYSTNANNALRLLGQRTGVEKLGEPNVTNISDRKLLLRSENVVQWASSDLPGVRLDLAEVKENQPGDNALRVLRQRTGVEHSNVPPNSSQEREHVQCVEENQIGDTPFPKTVIDAGPYSQAEMLAQINQSAASEHASRSSASSTLPSNEQSTNAQWAMVFRLSDPKSEAEVKKLLLDAGVEMPPTSFICTDTGYLLVHGTREQLTLVHRLVFNLDGHSESEEAADDQVGQFIASETKSPAPPYPPEGSTNLFMRTFGVNTNIFNANLRKQNGSLTNSASKSVKNLLSRLGIDWESPPGKSIYYNEKLGYLFVKATAADLDLAERTVGVLDQLNQSASEHVSRIGTSSAQPSNDDSTNMPQVLITADFYRMSDDDFKGLTSGLQFNPGEMVQGEWWSGARDEFSKIQSGLKTDGLVPLNRPRILTSSGKEAQMYIGTGTNGISLDCMPVVNGGNVDLKVNGAVVNTQEGTAVTNEFKMDAPVQSEGGMVIRARAVNGSGASNVVVILTAKILSESESARFQQRLVQIVKPTTTNDAADSHSSSPILFYRTFRMNTNVFLENLQRIDAKGSTSSTNSAMNVVTALRKLFTDTGVDLDSPAGKLVFYDERLGSVIVKSTQVDLDVIERVLDTLEPQLHIKARFISVPQNAMAGLEGFFHGQNPANGQFTGILTDTNLRAVLGALRSQKGVETLSEQEYITSGNRRTEMRTTEWVTVVTNMTYYDQGSLVPQTATYELGPIFDITPHILADGFTINLKAVPALTELLGYRQSTPVATSQSGQTGKQPGVTPILQTQKLSVEANLRDNQTLVLGGLTSHPHQHPKAGDVPELGSLYQANGVTNAVLVFITATIITPSGNRMHSEDEQVPGQPEIPEQPATTNRGGVEFSVPEPAQLPGHGAVPRSDPGETDRLLQEGKKLYERLKLKEAKAKFTEVIRLETNNATALYYLDAVKQMQTHFLPASSFSPDRGAVFLPVPNAYATNHLIFTGGGRQAIVKKLDKIHLDTVSYDGLPLNEVLKQLATQCRLHDPERKGINFLINNSPDVSATPASAATSEQPDVGSYIIKIPSLSDVRLADVLDAITLVSDHPLKYSVEDFAVVFSARDSGGPQLFMRTFRVDPNTFYSGLESVSAQSFGVVQNGGGGQNNGAVVGVVNAFPGANSVRGTGGAGSSQGGSGSLLNNQTDAGEASEDRNPQSLQGSSYGTQAPNQAPPPESHLKVPPSEVEHGPQVLKPPQLHLKAQFYAVPKGTFDSMRKILNATNPADGTLMGILTSRNAKAAMHVLQLRQGIEALGEPEITMPSGHRTVMRSTKAITIVTNMTFQEIWTNQEGTVAQQNVTSPQTSIFESGPILDAIPQVRDDGYAINLPVKASLTEFFGYANPPKNMATDSRTNSAGQPVARDNFWPAAQTCSQSVNVNLYDGQTLLLSLSEAQAEQIRFSTPDEEREAAVAKHIQAARRKAGEQETIVFITASIVDPTGARVHSDSELPLGPEVIPGQPQN